MTDQAKANAKKSAAELSMEFVQEEKRRQTFEIQAILERLMGSDESYMGCLPRTCRN